MAYKISDACVCCGACEAQCPVGAVGNHEADALAKEAVNEFARERGIVFDA